MAYQARVAELAAALSRDAVVTDPDVMRTCRTDESGTVTAGEPSCVVLADSVDDVVETMRWATRHRVPVVPRGAGTGLAGGADAVDGGVVLSVDRMTAIHEVSVDDQLARVEAGVITADLARAADRHGLAYLVDPGSAERSTLGGNIATNAGGFRCSKYGSTRESVLGLDVVLADGRLVHTGGRTSKNVTGYDLTSLFVGSEGTLGVIVGATVRLRARPLAPTTVAAFFATAEQAAEASLVLGREGLRPCLLELIDDVTLPQVDRAQSLGLPGAAMLLAQFDSAGADADAEAMERLCRRAGAGATEATTDSVRADRLVAIRRDALSALGRLGRMLVEDFVVPRSRLPEMLSLIRRIADRRGVLVGTVAHAADGNLHPTLMYDAQAAEVPACVWDAADEMFRAALALGGTLTGEHGVGVLKRRWLPNEFDAATLTVHGMVKAAFDPLHIMNPGKVLQGSAMPLDVRTAKGVAA